jgi:hypothetical protein
MKPITDKKLNEIVELYALTPAYYPIVFELVSEIRRLKAAHDKLERDYVEGVLQVDE